MAYVGASMQWVACLQCLSSAVPNLVPQQTTAVSQIFTKSQKLVPSTPNLNQWSWIPGLLCFLVCRRFSGLATSWCSGFGWMAARLKGFWLVCSGSEVVLLYVCLHASIYVRMYAQCIPISLCIYLSIHVIDVCVCVRVCVCACVCVCVSHHIGFRMI